MATPVNEVISENQQYNYAEDQINEVVSNDNQEGDLVNEEKSKKKKENKEE